MTFRQTPQTIRDLPAQDYDDLVELLYEAGGPDGGPLLERPAPVEASNPETSASAVNDMRRSHAMN